MKEYQEAQLLDLLKTGAPSAYTELYDRYWEEVFLYVVGVLHDRDESCDVVQDTFVTIFKQRHLLEQVRSLKAYVLTVARNKAVKHIRQNIKERDYLASLNRFMEDYVSSPEELLLADELQGLIADELAGLPPKMREVFLLSRDEGLNHKQIAEKLNISDKTVKKQISNSLKILRLKLGNSSFSSVVLIAILKYASFSL